MLSAEDRAEVLGIVQNSLLASPPGLLTQQFFPYLGPGRNSTGRTPYVVVYHDGTNAANSLVAATPGLSHQSTGNWVSVSYNQEQRDSDGMAAPTSSTLTMRTTGVYIFSANISFAGNGTGVRGVRFTSDGTTDVFARAVIPGHADGVTVSLVSRPVQINAGSTVTLQAFQNSTGNLALSALSFDSPFWGAVLVGNV